MTILSHSKHHLSTAKKHRFLVTLDIRCLVDIGCLTRGSGLVESRFFLEKP